MAPPIFSSTPATPRSDEKTAKARTMNNSAIKTVSHFRLIGLLLQDCRIYRMNKMNPVHPANPVILSLWRLRVRGRGTLLRRFSDRFDSALIKERNNSTAPEPDTLRIFPRSIRFD